MSRIKTKKKIFRLSGLLLSLIVALISLGTVYAVWHDTIAHKNELKADTFESAIVEDFKTGSDASGDVTKEVSFKNSSSSAAFLRVAYSETWKTAGTGDNVVILNNKVNGNDVAVKDFDMTNWTDGGDGWYYYNKVLAPGAESEAILEKVSFDYSSADMEEYSRANYQLYFRMELLQASDSPRTLNSDDVNEASSTAVWGKKASLSGTDVTWS